MAKCAACGKFIAAKAVAECYVCNNKYHLACAQLKESPKANCMWQCSTCRKRKSADTSSSSASTIASFEDAAKLESGLSADSVLLSKVDLGHEIRMIRMELRGMKDDLQKGLIEIRREVADLRQNISSCCERVDNLESRVQALESRQSSDASVDLTSKFEQTVKHLKLELNDRDQELLSSDLEIVNLPENSGENVVHTVELVAKKLGVTLEARDIAFAERVGPKPHRVSISEGVSEGASVAGGGDGRRGRRIVVRLARRGLRDELLQAARVRRGVTSADLGFAAPPRRFYLNERLTRSNKQLLYCARQAAERLGWRYTWTKGGKILTKQAEGKRIYSIRSEADLERVFGCDVFKNSNV